MLNPGLKDSVSASALPLGAATSELQQSILNLWSDSARFDAFALLRVSDTFNLFDSKQLYDNLPLIYDDQQVSGSNTTSVHSTARASTTIAVGTTAGKRIRQSFMRMNYQPGKSQLILCTGILDKSGGGTGIVRGFGYYDESNGIFLQDNEGVIQFVVRTSSSGSPVDNAVNQADWNIDKLDGTGTSGITLDFSKTQILFIDFEWLGVGRVRMGFVVDGVIYYAHQFLNANNLSVVYMSTPNLPVRYEIANDGTGVASSLEHICTSIMSEGGVQNNGYLRHQDTGLVSGLSANTAYAVMGGRLKSTHLGASVFVENISMIGTKDDQAHWELRIGGTVAGTFTYNDVTNSAVQIALGASTNTVTGGIEIDGGYFTTEQGVQFSVPNALRLGANIANTPQEWQLVVIPITNNITVRASVTWRELL